MFLRRIDETSEPTEVKKEWSYASTSRIGLQARTALTFIFCTFKAVQKLRAGFSC